MVAQINGVARAEQDLHRHLFGSDRLIPPRPLRDGIAEMQRGRCFYCARSLSRHPDADHFIPRVRCGIDAIENLVLANRSCNNDKRDLLPGTQLVTAWVRRNHDHAGGLAELGRTSRWDTDGKGTIAVARSIYRHLPEGSTPLWLGPKNIGTADPAVIAAALNP